MRVPHSRRHSSTSTTGRSSSASLSSALGSMRRGTRLKVRSRQQRRRPRCRIRSRPVPGRRPVRARWLPVPKGPRCQRTRPRPNESASLEGRRVPAVGRFARGGWNDHGTRLESAPDTRMPLGAASPLAMCCLSLITTYACVPRSAGREREKTELDTKESVVESGRLADSIFLSYLFYKVFSRPPRRRFFLVRDSVSASGSGR